MNYRFKLILIVIVLVSGKATATNELVVVITDKSSFAIELNNITMPVEIKVQEENGKVIFFDSLQPKDSYKRVFNLETIPDGTFVISLENENSILSRRLVKSFEGVQLKGASPEIIFKPRFDIIKKEVYVFLTNPANNTTYIDVYDKEGDLVTSGMNKGTVIQRRLDFSKVHRGKYTIKVRVGEQLFCKDIEIGQDLF